MSRVRADMRFSIQVLVAADLHAQRQLYADLNRAVNEHRPDIVVLNGDFLDAGEPDAAKLSPSECALTLASLACPNIVFTFGNHEQDDWLPFLSAWLEAGRVPQVLAGRALRFGPLVVVGFPCLMVEREDLFDPVPRPAMKWLSALAKQHGPAFRTLWLMHEPPCGTPLSAPLGPVAGNAEWMDAVEHYAPRLVLFGHDHATPLRHARWHYRMSNGTVFVNVGQSGCNGLRYSMVWAGFKNSTPGLPQRLAVKAFPLQEEEIVITQQA